MDQLFLSLSMGWCNAMTIPVVRVVHIKKIFEKEAIAIY